ncbi:MAG: ABC transporter permease [Eubacteriales bacterium]|mgnify:FL=1|nr:ABC transporter permease [bacterium]MDY2793347.1 ABC transporter permease [Eubacteriales bacterium]
MKKKSGWNAPLVLLGVWTLLLVLFPLLYVLLMSFLTTGESFGVEYKLTLANYRRLLEPQYYGVYRSSLRIACLTTAFTLLLGYPFAWFLSRQRERTRNVLLMLVVIPFWTSALMRTYGWMILLRNKGLLNGLLQALHLIDRPIRMLNTPGAVLLGMTYSLLPFMILSIYTSVEKLDYSLVEAARDLYASPLQVFWTVILPQTLPGILSGCVLVFVPAAGMYFISDLLGGGSGMLLGNLINNQLTVSRDWPFGAALSVILIVITFLTMNVYRRYTLSERRDDDA